MSRLKNARDNHITKWVIPAARRLLIDKVTSSAPTESLSKVAQIVMGQSPPGSSYNTDGQGVPFIGGPADLGIKYPQTKRWTTRANKLSQEGDVIVCVRATIGEPRWSNGVYCLGRGVAGLRSTDEELLSQPFLYRVVEGNEDYLKEKGTGTTFKTISKKHLASITVPMIPIRDQQMIGAFLEWLELHEDEKPDFHRAPKLPESLVDQVGIVARIEAFAGKVEEARRLREEATAEVHKLSDSALNEIFRTSKNLHMLSEVADYQRGRFSHRPRNDPRFYGGDYPFIQIRDIPRDSKWIVDHTQSLNEEGFGVSRLFPAGTIIVSIAATIGAVGILTFDSCMPDSLVGIQPRDRITKRDYLYYFLKYSQRHLEAIAPQSAQKNINIRILNQVQIPLPSLEEQKKIVAHLDRLQDKVVAVSNYQFTTQRELDALLPAILDKAVKGDL